MRQRSDGVNASSSLIVAAVAAAFLFGSCSVGTSSGGSAFDAEIAVAVAPTVTLPAPDTAVPPAVTVPAPDTAVPPTVTVPAPDTEAATAVSVPDPDAVSTSVARPAPQGAPATEPSLVAEPIGAGDLGLRVPITELECRGQFVTIVGNSVDPARYRYAVSDLLAAHPGSNYARTEYACSSLLPRAPNGSAVYVVFHGPFNTVLQACSARARVTGDAYVKVLFNIPPEDGRVDC